MGSEGLRRAQKGFSKFFKHMLRKFTMKNVAILASGNGSNAQKITEYFQNHSGIRIRLILTNKKEAYVLERARQLGVPALHFSAGEFRDAQPVLQVLQDYNIDYLILAGFLLLVPEAIIRQYPGRILNIHPALLPKFGGKGMYGHHVHEAVINAGETESGISIHVVNEHFDEGQVIFQAKCPVFQGDTPDTLATRIHELEHTHFPKIIESYILKR